MDDERPTLVLIVDDEDSFRLPLAERLPKYLQGYVIDAVRNGAEAIRAVAERKEGYDVALIDQVLHPLPDGIEVMRRIKELHPSTQVIIFTGWETDSGLEALRAGAYRHMSKSSFNVEELAIMVKMAVEHQRLMRKGWLARVLETGIALQSSLESDVVLEKILRGIQDLGYDRVRLYLLSEDGQMLLGKMQTGGPEGFESMSRPLAQDVYSQGTFMANRPRMFRKDELGADLWEKGLKKEDVVEWIEIPLVARGRPLGKISVDNKFSRRRFLIDELDPLMLFANQAAHAIYNARTFEQSQKDLTNLSRLFEASHGITCSLDLDETLQIIIHNAVAATQGHSASLSLVGEDGQPAIRTTVGYDKEMLKKTEVRPTGISIEVIKTKEPFTISNIDEFTGIVNPGMFEAGFKAAICLPLLVKERPIGAMWVNYIELHPFSPEEVRLLQTFANQAAIAIENARLFTQVQRNAQESEQRARHLAAVQRACTAISSSPYLGGIMKATCRWAVELFGVDHSGLVLFENFEQGHVVAEYPYQNVLGRRIQIRGIPLEEQLIASKKPLIIRDVSSEPLLGLVRDDLLASDIQSVLIVPLVVKDRVIGSFSLDAVGKQRDFPLEEVELCQIVAAQVAAAFDNANLLERQKDNLTVLQTFYNTLSVLLTTLEEVGPILDSITGSLYELFGLATCTIGLADETEEYLEFRVYRGLERPTKRRIKDLPQDFWKSLRQEKRPIFVADLTSRPDLAGQLERTDLKSFAALPLQGREKFLGIITMGSADQIDLTQEDWDMIQGLADQAAVAIENMEMHRLERERAHRWRTVANAGAKLSQSLERSPKELLEIIAQAACDIISADCAVIYPYYADTKTFDASNYSGHGLMQKEFLLKEKRREQPGWAGRIIAEGRIIINDFAKEAGEYAEKTRFFREEAVRAFVGIRLDAAKEPVGILYVNFRQSHRWTHDELEAIQPFADQAALTIQHTLLQRKRNVALQGIIKAGQTITSTLELRKVLEQIVATAMATLQADMITLHPYSQSTGEFWPEFVHRGGEDSNSLGWSPRNSEVAEKVVISDTAHFSDDSLSHEILGGDFARREKIVASAALPLRVGREIVGVMFVNYRTPHHFTSDEIDVIQMFVNETAIAIHNARLFEQAQKGRRQLQTVIDMSRAFISSLDLDHVIDTLLSGLHGHFPNAHSRMVALYDPDIKQLTIHPASYQYYWNERKASEIRAPMPLEKSIEGWVIIHKKSLNVPDVRQDENLKLIPDTRSRLTAPIIFGDDTVGVLTLESRELAAFDDEDQRLIEALADQAGVAIENARRYKKLEETQETLKARTAVAWMGMAGSTWFHSIRGHAAAIKDWLLLIRQKLC